jgi:hypothetical protein
MSPKDKIALVDNYGGVAHDSAETLNMADVKAWGAS